MKRASLSRLLGCVLMLGMLAACGAPKPPPPVLSKQSPVALRAMQIRAFDTTDKRHLVHAVIATLQDLGYSVEKVDYGSGTVSAAKLVSLRLTAVVYPHGPSQMSVRANAMVQMGVASTQVDDPKFYQELFFAPLSQALFLSAEPVADDPQAPPPAMPAQSPPATHAFKS
jgi:hypothetical protein